MRLLLILLAISITACKQPAANTGTANTVTRYPADSLLNKYELKNREMEEKYLELPSLRNGADSFEIRIRTWQAFSMGHHLFIIRAEKDSLIKKHFYFEPPSLYRPDGAEGTTTSDYSIMHRFAFTGGDSAFMALYKGTRLDTMPTQRLIPGIIGGCLDGAGFTIEIAGKNHYRCLDYDNLDCYHNAPQLKIMTNFIEHFYAMLPEQEMIFHAKLCKKIARVW